jgi:hypothetical protein
LDAAACFPGSLARGEESLVVGGGLRMVADPVQGNDVERPVELAIAAAVQALGSRQDPRFRHHEYGSSRRRPALSAAHRTKRPAGDATQHGLVISARRAIAVGPFVPLTEAASDMSTRYGG